MLVQFLLSLLAVAALVGIAHLVGFSGDGPALSMGDAREQFSLAPDGFDPVEVIVDRAGHGALAVDANGKAMALVRHGRRFVVLPVRSVKVRNDAIAVRLAAPTERLLRIEDDGPWPGWVHDLPAAMDRP